jgi:hypothetical protein
MARHGPIQPETLGDSRAHNRCNYACKDSLPDIKPDIDNLSVVIDCIKQYV